MHRNADVADGCRASRQMAAFAVSSMRSEPRKRTVAILIGNECAEGTAFCIKITSGRPAPTGLKAESALSRTHPVPQDLAHASRPPSGFTAAAWRIRRAFGVRNIGGAAPAAHGKAPTIDRNQLAPRSRTRSKVKRDRKPAARQVGGRLGIAWASLGRLAAGSASLGRLARMQICNLGRDAWAT